MLNKVHVLAEYTKVDNCFAAFLPQTSLLLGIKKNLYIVRLDKLIIDAMVFMGNGKYCKSTPNPSLPKARVVW